MISLLKPLNSLLQRPLRREELPVSCDIVFCEIMKNPVFTQDVKSSFFFEKRYYHMTQENVQDRRSIIGYHVGQLYMLLAVQWSQSTVIFWDKCSPITYQYQNKFFYSNKIGLLLFGEMKSYDLAYSNQGWYFETAWRKVDRRLFYFKNLH